MASKPTILVLGAGPRVGASTAKLFAHNGYNVAIVSRKGTGTRDAEGFLSLKADFTQPDSIPGLFDAVKAEFHTAPSVVIYNAATLTPQPDQNNPLSIPVENISKDLNVNTVTPYVAAQEALKGWETLSKETKKTFIYTGNGLNVNISPLAFVLNLGIGKRASSYWIGLADSKFSAQEYR
jgi:NAD(P)-dependent dehydrogenase (short-subunit alcohol dehydrogenase family)